ncbi:MAG: preprotein translocase subunit YajC [Micavibrio sp.]|nr:preprotein translocase subunit YajC [Micavibrio sp.]
MFITPAWAQDAASAATDASASGPGIVMTVLPLVGIFCVFYIMVIRPQNKRIIEHRKMINNLAKGDKVITGGGLLATVKKLVNEDDVLLELNAGIEVVAVRNTIMTVRDSAHKRELEKEAREKGEAAVKKLTNQG